MSIELIKASSALLQSPKVMLLSVTEFPWAVSLFPIFSSLASRVTYYEKLSCG